MLLQTKGTEFCNDVIYVYDFIKSGTLCPVTLVY